MVPEAYLQKVLQLAAQGVRDFHFPEYDTDWDSDAYLTVAGQNSNNSVRISNHFFDTLAKNGFAARGLTARQNSRKRVLP